MEISDLPAPSPFQKVFTDCLSQDVSVDVDFHFHWYAVGKIPASQLRGQLPLKEDFEKAAYAHEYREIISAQLDLIDGAGAWIKSEKMEWPVQLLEERIAAQSLHGPVVVLEVGHSSRLVTPLSLAQLARLVIDDGCFVLDGKPLDDHPCADYPEYYVLDQSLRYEPHAYHWLLSAAASLLEGLMFMLLHVRKSGRGLNKGNACAVLLADPDRWALVAHEFVERFGFLRAEELLGKMNLLLLLDGGFCLADVFHSDVECPGQARFSFAEVSPCARPGATAPSPAL